MTTLTHEHGFTLAAAQKLAQALANTTKLPTYVVAQGEKYLIQDDADINVYGGRAHIVGTYQPRSADDLPGIENEPPEPPVYPAPGGRAVTRTSILIDQALQQNRLCPNCQGAHWGWQCPEIKAVLFAPESTPWHSVDLGRELCRMKWRDFRAFVALLLSVPSEHLVIYAASYQAFIRAQRPDSDLTISQVIQAWAKDMARGGAENERPVAA